MSGNIFREPQSTDDSSNQAKGSLLNEVEKQIKTVEEYRESLRDHYPRDALKDLSSSFEKLSTQWTEYLFTEKGVHYDVINRSGKRTEIANRIIVVTTDTSRWFHYCSTGEASFNPIDGRLKVLAVLIELRNLKAYLPDYSLRG